MMDMPHEVEKSHRPSTVITSSCIENDPATWKVGVYRSLWQSVELFGSYKAFNEGITIHTYAISAIASLSSHLVLLQQTIKGKVSGVDSGGGKDVSILCS
jgi:hypothetical protein